LRERTEDIPLLVGAILEDLGQTDKGGLFTDEVYKELSDRAWPGNVRELRKFVERLVVTEEFETPSAAPSPGEDAAPGRGELDALLEETFRAGKERIIAEFERRYLKSLFEWSGGNVSRAARKAGLDRMYLHRLLQRHGIRRDAALD
jgi:DNA-binding NtrC family response regulator